MGTKVLPDELPPRGRSIQAGSLCYINRCAVDVVARLKASKQPQRFPRVKKLSSIAPSGTKTPGAMLVEYLHFYPNSSAEFH